LRASSRLEEAFVQLRKLVRRSKARIIVVSVVIDVVFDWMTRTKVRWVLTYETFEIAIQEQYNAD